MTEGPEYHTLPSREAMQQIQVLLPESNHPGFNPHALVYPAALSTADCAHIVHAALEQESYQASRCGAISRELPINHKVFGPVADIVEHATSINDGLKAEHDGQYHGWMQSYSAGSDGYVRHMDSNPGSFRKVSAVVLLSPGDAYEGGDLVIEAVPGVAAYNIPRARGTVVVFNPFLIHYVTPVTDGLRRTLNVGLYGRPWR